MKKSGAYSIDPKRIITIFFICLPCWSFSQFLKTKLTENEQEFVQRVFDKLLQTKGHFTDLPKLQFSGEDQYVAYMRSNGSTKIIGIEDKAVKLCLSFGERSEDALAALLAHEVIHYYEHRFTSKYFLTPDADLLYSVQVNLEKEADTYGSFLAFAAGFNSLDIMSELLSKIYYDYQLPDNLKGYAHLPERIQIAKAATEKAQTLALKFKAANYFMALHEYGTSAAIFQHILESFSSREILNNLGASLLLQVLWEGGEELFPYVYPIEIDAKSRLESSKIRNPGINRLNAWKKKLNLSIGTLENAILLDKNYLPAQINLACAFQILHQLSHDPLLLVQSSTTATLALARAQKLQQSEAIAKANMILGILKAQEGEIQNASAFFEVARKAQQFRDACQHNQQVLSGNSGGIYAEWSKPFTQRNISIGKIEEIDLNQWLLKQADLPDFEIIRQDMPPINFSQEILQSSNLLFFEIGLDTERLFVGFQISQSFPINTLLEQLEISSNAEKAYASLGKPDRKFPVGIGEYLIYENMGLILFVDQEGEINEIVKYLAEIP